MPDFQEKPRRRAQNVPVPETNTRGRGEKPKVLGLAPVKELGKLAP